jgi:hypothetical protein
MKPRTSLLIILVVSLCSAASASGKKVTFKGRIAAYRPADRMQVVSAVANKELLLFQTESVSHDWLKIVYVHQGFSELKDDVLSGTREVFISIRRDASCDQTLGAFEKEAPAIPLKGDSTASSTERVVFASSVTRPPKSYRLKCYVLERWEPMKQGESSKIESETVDPGFSHDTSPLEGCCPATCGCCAVTLITSAT